MATALPIADAPAARAHALDDIRDALAPLGHEVEILESALNVRPWIDLRGLKAACEEVAGSEFARRIRSVRGWRSHEDPSWIQLVLLVEPTEDDPIGIADNEFIALALERIWDRRPELADALFLVGHGSTTNGV